MTTFSRFLTPGELAIFSASRLVSIQVALVFRSIPIKTYEPGIDYNLVPLGTVEAPNIGVVTSGCLISFRFSDYPQAWETYKEKYGIAPTLEEYKTHVSLGELEFTFEYLGDSDETPLWSQVKEAQKLTP